MRIYRLLCKSLYSPSVLRGEGGLVADGRWHRLGAPIVYAASSESLAVLEVRVHVGNHLPKAPYTMHTIELPDELAEELDARILSQGWNAVPHTRVSQDFGAEWLKAQRSLALRLPSIHSRSDSTILINPAHPDATRVRIIHAEPYRFDARLFATPTPG